MANIEKYLLEISKNTRTVAATNVAKILGPSISSSISDNTSTPDTSFDNGLNEIENEDLLKSTVNDHTESPEPIPQLGDKRPQMGEQKEAKNKNSFPYSKDLIPAGQLTYIYIPVRGWIKETARAYIQLNPSALGFNWIYTRRQWLRDAK